MIEKKKINRNIPGMTPKQIGALLRKAREKRGWTWNRTATESGLKADQIKGIEQASKAYTNDSLLVLAKVLGYEQHFLPAKGSEAALPKGETGSDDVMPSSLSRPNTCIRCGNAGELHYVLKWAEAKGRKVDKWMWDRNKFPLMVFFEPGTKHLGWNDRDDRNCDIVPFTEAVGICDWA